MAKLISDKASDWFSKGVLETMLRCIEENDGREVFFTGHVSWDEETEMPTVTEIEPQALGAEGSVPAIKKHCRPGDVIVHNHPSGEIKPSEADISVASVLGDIDVASFIIDNACERVHVIVKPIKPKKIEPLNLSRVEEFFKPSGTLSRNLPYSFEHRPEQWAMSETVAKAFNENKIAMVEAGTGVGKSFAYLIPAILWAVQNDERVVISTNTINLQEQIIHKDIPLLKEILGVEFEAVLMKGRSNYLGLRKTNYARMHADMFTESEASGQLSEIFEWLENTPDGSLTDLSFRPLDDVWERVVSEAENCLRINCPTYDKCFFYKARRAASRARIIVVNHHLLMADLSIRGVTGNWTDTCVLPPFQRLVIDEAHNLEDVATSYFTIEFSRFGLEKILGRLAPQKKPEKGLFRYVARKVSEYRDTIFEKQFEEAIKLIEMTLPELRGNLSEMSDYYLDLIASRIPEFFPDKKFEPGRTYQIRLTGELGSSDFYHELIRDSADQISNAIFNMVSKGERFLNLVKTIPYKDDDSVRDSLLEFRAYLDKLINQGERLRGFIEREKGFCRWLDYIVPRESKYSPRVRLCSAPIHVGSKMRESLFKPLKTIVMTSATLTVDRSFSYIRSRVGLELDHTPESNTENKVPKITPPVKLKPGETLPFVLTKDKLVTLLLDSPFQYQEQALVAAAVDMPMPDSPGFARALPGAIIQTVKRTNGRALVLFTSYKLLDKIYEQTAPEIEQLGYNCLRQGDVSRHLLLERFKEDTTSVLFATSSFWEGIDVPGDSLQCLIMTRLPFRVPTEPIWQARVEELEQHGRNAFMELTVPQAVVKFKQGFGRLIRRRDDRGIVLILDSRVISKRYGQIFLRSLPTRSILKANGSEILESISEFVGRK